MTEVNIPLYGEYGRPHVGTCGRVYDRYFEVEIGDPDTDQLLPRGTVGEIMVRPKAAFGFMAGYRGMPERTVEAWRNLWFHTGDAGVMAEDGYVTYVDRMKDCIRRRGENISSFEVELAVSRLEGVAEVAAYAVPSGIAGGEDEIMLAVVPAKDAALDPEIIASYLDRMLPRFDSPATLRRWIICRRRRRPKCRKPHYGCVGSLLQHGTGKRIAITKREARQVLPNLEFLTSEEFDHLAIRPGHERDFSVHHLRGHRRDP
jgi:acyl-CoA synthetase (AMP-forming)/AMP-acid ligase II